MEIVISDVQTVQYRDVLDYLHLSVKTTTTRCTTTKRVPEFYGIPNRDLTCSQILTTDIAIVESSYVQCHDTVGGICMGIELKKQFNE